MKRFHNFKRMYNIPSRSTGGLCRNNILGYITGELNKPSLAKLYHGSIPEHFINLNSEAGVYLCVDQDTVIPSWRGLLVKPL